MHKKLEAELIHLAHQILKLNKNTNISELQEKAREIYENLSVLSFVDEFFVESPEVTDDKTDFLAKFRKTVAEDVSAKTNIALKDKNPTKTIEKAEPIEKKVEAKVEKEEPKVEKNTLEVQKSEKEETDKLIKQTVDTIKSEAKEIVNKIQTPQPKTAQPNAFDEEMKDSISADVAANMFERLEKNTEPKAPNALSASTKSERVFEEEPKAAKPNALSASTKSERVFEEEPKATKTNALSASTKSERVFEEEPKAAKTNALSASTKSERVFEEEVIKEPVKPKVNIATKQEIPQTKEAPKSLNDRISSGKIQVGLNDRIAFVKHLFNYSQEDFNSVLSQLNNFTSEQESLNYIKNQIKLEYDWSGKEEYEARLLDLIERKFK